jgi:hypothetical protein
MKELFAGFSGSLSSFVRSWLLPATVAVGLWRFFIFPHVREHEPFSSIAALDAAGEVLAIAFCALVIAYVVASMTNPLYRFLEGYSYWPRSLRERRREHHKMRRERLKNDDAARHDRLERQRLRAQLDQYPRLAASVMPTRLGNVLRAAESYGHVQYGLDTVILWWPLMSVCDDGTKAALDDARAVMDFFVGVLILAPLFASSAGVAALVTEEPVAFHGLWSLALLYPAYLGAVSSAGLYGRLLRSVADTARHALADQLRIAVPTDISRENELWTAVSDYSAWGPYFAKSSDWQRTISLAREQFEAVAKEQ